MVAKRGICILAKGASGASDDGEVRLSHRGKLHIFHTDICFIEDCRTTLAQRTGFVVADTELIKYGEASTPESMEVLSREASLWPLRLFNTGHFASDTPLYSLADLESTCEKYKETCLLSPHHEQAGINLLALVSGVTFTIFACLPTIWSLRWPSIMLTGTTGKKPGGRAGRISFIMREVGPLHSTRSAEFF